MKKVILAAIAIGCFASSALATWTPTLMKLSAASDVTYLFDHSQLQIPVTVSGKPGTAFFAVYTHNAVSDSMRNGMLGWHYINKIDTSVFISVGIGLSVGSNSVTWDGKDDDGGWVPTGTYTYYLWAYDSQSAKERVNYNLISAVSGGGRSAHIQMTDTSGVALAQPVFYSASGDPVRRWIIGTDPADSDLIETTDLVFDAATYGGCSPTSVPAPGSGDYVFARCGLTGTAGTGVQAILKAKWINKGVAELATEWGESGYSTWMNYASAVVARDKTSGPTVLGDYVYSSTSTCGVTGVAPASGIQKIEVETGVTDSRVDVGWTGWVNLAYADLTSASFPSGGPNGVIPAGNNLLLNAHLSCLKTLINPLAESADELLIWANGNGDYFLDKHSDSSETTHAWVCHDTAPAPYMYGGSVDANGFVAITSYDTSTSTSFGLLGPDGDGIALCAFAGATSMWKGFNEFVDYDSAYDGLYCDDQTSTVSSKTVAERTGIYYVGHDSIKGTISFVGVNETAPAAFSVAQNTPNPFNPTTTITFTLSKAGKTTVEVFNAAGQKVDTIVNGSMSAGPHSVTWNAAKFSAGVYFYTVKSGSLSKTMKMTLLK